MSRESEGSPQPIDIKMLANVLETRFKGMWGKMLADALDSIHEKQGCAFGAKSVIWCNEFGEFGYSTYRNLNRFQFRIGHNRIHSATDFKFENGNEFGLTEFIY